MSELSKRMRALVGKTWSESNETGHDILALCGQIESLESEIAVLRRSPTMVLGHSLEEIQELINESFTRRREFRYSRTKDPKK